MLHDILVTSTLRILVNALFWKFGYIIEKPCMCACNAYLKIFQAKYRVYYVGPDDTTLIIFQ